MYCFIQIILIFLIGVGIPLLLLFVAHLVVKDLIKNWEPSHSEKFNKNMAHLMLMAVIVQLIPIKTTTYYILNKFGIFKMSEDKILIKINKKIKSLSIALEELYLFDSKFKNEFNGIFNAIKERDNKIIRLLKEKTDLTKEKAYFTKENADLKKKRLILQQKMLI